MRRPEPQDYGDWDNYVEACQSTAVYNAALDSVLKALGPE